MFHSSCMAPEQRLRMPNHQLHRRVEHLVASTTGGTGFRRFSLRGVGARKGAAVSLDMLELG
jgi:hypothetical protein